ncbi:hypothetical protein NDU88_005862 [Pleurodeles waltl]|uniref:Uncharacterized protein n=1 Tax=Pleurodeles waltl TaxID=8319 RepID=A0AAV7SMW3_PLEWA|nr:hypothetical protein NDU88_005862 [Pleurodeles waltl]
MTPLMFRILAVAYPELDGRLRASQQTQGGEYNIIQRPLRAVKVSGSRTSTSAKKSPGPVVPVTGMWSAPGTRPASVAWSHSTTSPPPVKHQKLDSARWERGKNPASKAAHKCPGRSVDSAVTPPKVGKGQKKLPKSGRSSTAEKTAIIPAAQEATARVTAQEASPIVTGQEATTRVTAQEARPIVTGQDATASHSPAAQEGPASHSPAAQEGPGSHSPAAQ